MRIFIIGYMLSGKSTIGKKIANKLSYDFIDTDKLIENTYHYTVNDIFEKFSEDVFRQMEKKMLENIINKDNIVIATGGGLPCFNDNMDTIKQNGKSIYLKMTSKEIISRLINSKHPRPLLKSLSDTEKEEFIEKNIKEREVFYNKADIIIDGISCKVDDIISQINI